MIRTHYAAKLCAKIKMMCLNYAYVPKAKLCAKEPITRFFARSHNRIILEGLIFLRPYKMYIYIYICMHVRMYICTSTYERYLNVYIG